MRGICAALAALFAFGVVSAIAHPAEPNAVPPDAAVTTDTHATITEQEGASP